MIAIAFAIVIAATLFAPGDHSVLCGFSVLGLWLAAFSDDTIVLKHNFPKAHIDIKASRTIHDAAEAYLGAKTAGEKAKAAAEELKGEIK